MIHFDWCTMCLGQHAEYGDHCNDCSVAVCFVDCECHLGHREGGNSDGNGNSNGGTLHLWPSIAAWCRLVPPGAEYLEKSWLTIGAWWHANFFLVDVFWSSQTSKLVCFSRKICDKNISLFHVPVPSCAILRNSGPFLRGYVVTWLRYVFLGHFACFFGTILSGFHAILGHFSCGLWSISAVLGPFSRFWEHLIRLLCPFMWFLVCFTRFLWGHFTRLLGHFARFWGGKLTEKRTESS